MCILCGARKSRELCGRHIDRFWLWLWSLPHRRLLPARRGRVRVLCTTLMVSLSPRRRSISWPMPPIFGPDSRSRRYLPIWSARPMNSRWRSSLHRESPTCGRPWPRLSCSAVIEKQPSRLRGWLCSSAQNTARRNSFWPSSRATQRRRCRVALACVAEFLATTRVAQILSLERRRSCSLSSCSRVRVGFKDDVGCLPQAQEGRGFGSYGQWRVEDAV